VSGCLYADPINQRPSLDIQRMEPTGDVYRTDTVKLKAIASDPEGQLVSFQWRAYLCDSQPITDVMNHPGCDAVPFYTAILENASFIVPPRRADVDAPVEQVLVLLEGQDEYGATARPIQQLVLGISDHPPDLVLRKDSRYGYVVNTSINIYAKLGDADDGPDKALPLDWKVFTPINQPAYAFEDIPVPQDAMDPTHIQLGKRFTPAGVGDWEIQAVATDPLEKACIEQGLDNCTQTTESVMITVIPDHAPCISQVAPIAAPAGSALPMTDPTLFQVNVVVDDLDPWPAVPSDPVLETTTFHWSILPPGASTRQALTVDSNQVALDPASYSPGDIVELRVEIADRNMNAGNTPITCADANPICSVISDNSCIQRLTWRVEVR